MTATFGAAIVSRKKNTVRDFEITDTKQDALEFIDENNARLDRLGVKKVRWQLARIDILTDAPTTDTAPTEETDMESVVTRILTAIEEKRVDEHYNPRNRNGEVIVRTEDVQALIAALGVGAAR